MTDTKKGPSGTIPMVNEAEEERVEAARESMPSDTTPRPDPNTQPLTHDEVSADAVTAQPFGKITVEMRNTSDLFFNSQSSAWSAQVPTADTAYAERIIRAIRQVNDEFDDKARHAGKRAPSPASPAPSAKAAPHPVLRK